MFRLDGKVAMVTGSTSGIGRAIAEAMSAAGAHVVVSSESAEATAQVSAELGATGIPCDVTDPEALKALIDGTLERHGQIDILVCNAGIAGTNGDRSLEDFDRVMAVNLRSQVALTSLALPHIAKQQGSIMLIASLAGLRGNASINGYALAKAGVVQLARNIAVQWGPQGVRANAISPGLIDTKLLADLPQTSDFMKRRMQMTPLRRVGTVEEVAGAAVFLASPAGGFITGHNLAVDGGTLITDGS